MTTDTYLETLEDKAERLNERFIEMDPASDKYDELWDELQMLDREIEREMDLIREDEEFFSNQQEV